MASRTFHSRGRERAPAETVTLCTISTSRRTSLRLLDDLCFIPFRRQEHEVPAMLKEIIRQAALPGGGLGQVIHEPESEPEPEPER
eukprot:COSAG06_NODE_6321_length_2984_cov_1.050260_5_plen_86_part_00